LIKHHQYTIMRSLLSPAKKLTNDLAFVNPLPAIFPYNTPMTTENFNLPRQTRADHPVVMRAFLVPLVDLAFRQPDVLTSGGEISCCALLPPSCRLPATNHPQTAAPRGQLAGKKYVNGNGKEDA
jgi:hypothetical protein